MTAEEKLLKSISVDLKIGKMRVGDREMNYVEGGSGPNLLLIHGGNIGWGQWYPNLLELAKFFRVTAVDLFGGGRSTSIDFSKLDLEKDLIDPVADFISAKRLENFSILGSSIGGWIAMKIALRKKFSLKKLVLADAIGFSDYRRFSDKMISIYPLAKLISKTVLNPKRNNRRIEDFLRSVFYNSKISISPEFIDYFYETMAISHNLLFISRLASAGITKRLFLRDQFKDIKVPTAIIWGERDALMPLDKNQQNFGLIYNADVRILADAGHIPSIEKPEAFNREVIQILLRQ